MTSWWENGPSAVPPPDDTLRASATSPVGSRGSSDEEEFLDSIPTVVGGKYSQVKSFWASNTGTGPLEKNAQSDTSPVTDAGSEQHRRRNAFQRAPATSISTLSASCSGSGSGSNSAEEGPGSSQEDLRVLKRSSSSLSKNAYPIDDDIASCYSHASAVDLSGILLPGADLHSLPTTDSDIGHPTAENDELTKSILEPQPEEYTTPNKWKPTPFVPVCPEPAPELPKLSIPDEFAEPGEILWDSSARASLALRKSGETTPSKHENEAVAPTVTGITSRRPSDISSEAQSEGNLLKLHGTAPEIAETGDELGTNDIERRCSFAESFARRDMLTTSKRQKASAKRRSKIYGGKQQFSAEQIVDRAAAALAELLDQNRLAAQRLTEGTRAFATVFSINEKHVFGSVVRGALHIIRRGSARTLTPNATQGDRFKLHSRQLPAAPRTSLEHAEDGSKNNQIVALQADHSSAVAKGAHTRRGVKRAVTDADLARRILFGVPSGNTKSSEKTASRRSDVPPVMLITDGKSKDTQQASRSEFSRGSTTLVVPKGPLTTSVSNEIMEVHLPFGASLLSILAVLARLDCDLIFKKRKNKSADAIDRRGKSTAVVHARARQDRSGRNFVFSVLVSGSSPTRITFRRPRFIALRRVDDYVDIVVDGKELISEFCNSMWGR